MRGAAPYLAHRPHQARASSSRTRPSPSGRQSLPTEPHYPTNCASGTSHYSEMGLRAAGEGPPPRPWGSAATTAARMPGWKPIESILHGNSPQQLLWTGPELKRKRHARRGATSLPGWRAPPPARTRALPGVASEVPARLAVSDSRKP